MIKLLVLIAIIVIAVNIKSPFLTLDVSLGSDETVKLPFVQKQTIIDLFSEQTMFNMVNRERTNRGLKPLKSSTALKTLARNYAEDMFSRGFFSHLSPDGKSPFDRMQENGIAYETAGENLAMASNVKLAHQALMQSSSHRANILSEDYSQIGIGVIDGGVYGELFVQEFTN